LIPTVSLTESIVEEAVLTWLGALGFELPHDSDKVSGLNHYEIGQTGIPTESRQNCRDSWAYPDQTANCDMNRDMVSRFGRTLPEQRRVAPSWFSRRFSRQSVANCKPWIRETPTIIPTKCRDSDGLRRANRESCHLSRQNGGEPLSGHFAGHFVRPGRSRFPK
jgi:hypothetical protein